MTRSVVILGFPGVQPLDLVGPHDVFAGADIRYGESVDDLQRCFAALTPEGVEAARLATVALQSAFDWAPIADRHLAFLEAVTDD